MDGVLLNWNSGYNCIVQVGVGVGVGVGVRLSVGSSVGLLLLGSSIGSSLGSVVGVTIGVTKDEGGDCNVYALDLCACDLCFLALILILLSLIFTSFAYSRIYSKPVSLLYQCLKVGIHFSCTIWFNIVVNDLTYPFVTLIST